MPLSVVPGLLNRAALRRYLGGMAWSDVVTRIDRGDLPRTPLGRLWRRSEDTMGSIVEEGHILPASAAPAESAILADLDKIQDQIAAAQAAPAAAPA